LEAKLASAALEAGSIRGRGTEVGSGGNRGVEREVVKTIARRLGIDRDGLPLAVGVWVRQPLLRLGSRSLEKQGTSVVLDE
jgi:hypothetical protein